MSALLDSLFARCKDRPPPDATRYASTFKSWAYQQISSALWLSNARNCLRLAVLKRSNHYAVFNNPVNATKVDDYVPAANTSAAPVGDAMFVTQDVATPVHTPALPSSAPALPSSAPSLPAPALSYLFSGPFFFLLFYFFGFSVMTHTFTPHPPFPFPLTLLG